MDRFWSLAQIMDMGMRSLYRMGSIALFMGVLMMDVALSQDSLDLEVEEVYVPREPTKAELKRYALNDEIEGLWGAIFDDVNNGALRQQIAQKYNQLNNGDIAEHELNRALELGIPENELLADLGRSYLLQNKMDEFFEKISIENAATHIHGETYLVLGMAYDKLENYEEAFLNFYQAEVLLNDHPDLYAPMARLYSRIGYYDRAELYVDKALSLNGIDPEFLLLKGILVERRSGSTNSYQYFERANFHKSDQIEIESKLGSALYNLGRHDESMLLFRRILAKDSRHPFANFMIATLFAEGNNIRTATRYLNQAGLTAYGNYPPALMLWGKLAYATKDYDSVIAPLSDLIDIDPDHHEARTLLSAAYLQLNNPMAAAETLNYLSGLDILSELDHLLLGSAYALAGDNDNAMLNFSAASEKKSENLTGQEKDILNQFQRGDSFGVVIDLPGIINKTQMNSQKAIIDVNNAIDKKDFEHAFSIAADLVNNDRNNAVGYHLLGLIYLEQGRVDEARSNFRRVIELNRDFFQARIQLARIDFALDNPNSAVNHLNSILNRDESYIPAYELLYEYALSRGDDIRAERYLSTAISANPDIITPRIKLIEYYYERNVVQRAIRRAEQLLQQFPDYSIANFLLGKGYLLSGRINDAIGLLKRSIEIDPGTRDSHLLLSEAFISKGLISEAREALGRGMPFVEDRVPLILKSIEITKIDRDFKKAYQFANQLKLEQETLSIGNILQGEINIVEGRFADAIDAFLRAQKAGASDNQVLYRLAEAYSKSGDKDHAIEIASSHLAAHENDVNMRHFIALFQFENGNTEEAIFHYEYLLDRNQNDIVANNNLALIYLQQEDLEKAYQYAFNAYNLPDFNVDVAKTYAQVLILQEKLDDARNVLTETVKIASYDIEAKSLLATLE